MHLRDLKQIVDSTADAAFINNGEGQIVAWNQAMINLTGIGEEQALGQQCLKLFTGEDECGIVCSENCVIRQAVIEHRPISNFDMCIVTRQGRQWVNVSVLILDLSNSLRPHSIHIFRAIDLRKRLEMLMRDFVMSEAVTGAEKPFVVNRRASASQADLTTREIEILAMLSKGAKTAVIAETLHISRATVNNHIQHILGKLNAHTRLEAIRRAEQAGLLITDKSHHKLASRPPLKLMSGGVTFDV